MTTLYYNGTILTMKGAEAETAEAVLVQDGRILAVGTMNDVMQSEEYKAAADAGTLHDRDLAGTFMMPAFIDAHSHITAVAQVMGNCDLKGVKSFAEIVGRLKEFQTRTGVKPGAWIIGVGYDHNFLKEKRHPDKFLLDQEFPDRPVMLSHASGHMGVVNSQALAQLGITEETEDPIGGIIGRVPGTREPSGYLEETAFTSSGNAAPKPTLEQLARQLAMAEQLYLKHGITTIQDGITRQTEWNLLKYMAERELLHADIVSYVDLKSNRSILQENQEYAAAYQNHLRIGGYKIFLDGSPQGRTAWMSRPYEDEEKGGGAEDRQTSEDHQASEGRQMLESRQTSEHGQAPESGTSGGYCGYPIYQDGEVEQFFETALRERRQLLVHCNGDAAAQQMIDACRRAAEKTGIDPALIRPVMIHAQLVREDELKEMAKLSVTASFFVAHVYYWGDIHLKNFGPERALRISPARTALREGVNVTFHQDSPVIWPDMLETVWCAVNRLSKEGAVMGAAEQISPYEALQAVTAHAAVQYGEGDKKGTIEPGRNADFVILDASPLEVLPERIRDIRVLETIKNGRTLYQAGDR